MSRVKRGVTTHQKHKKILKLAKGYIGGRSKIFQQANEAVLHAGNYAFAGRKLRKRDMRKLWITQMNIALGNEGLSYSKFIAQMKAKNINLDRKIMAELAVKEPADFKKIVSQITA